MRAEGSFSRILSSILLTQERNFKLNAKNIRSVKMSKFCHPRRNIRHEVATFRKFVKLCNILLSPRKWEPILVGHQVDHLALAKRGGTICLCCVGDKDYTLNFILVHVVDHSIYSPCWPHSPHPLNFCNVSTYCDLRVTGSGPYRCDSISSRRGGWDDWPTFHKLVAYQV